MKNITIDKRFFATQYPELHDLIEQYSEVDLHYVVFWDIHKHDSFFVVRVEPHTHAIVSAVEMVGAKGSESLESIVCHGSITSTHATFHKEYPPTLVRRYSWLPAASIVYQATWRPLFHLFVGIWSCVQIKHPIAGDCIIKKIRW